jgi:hypothetical protein
MAAAVPERSIDMHRKLPAPQAHAEPVRPNPYPHRLSVDVDDEMYRALRLLAAKEGCTIVQLVRAGIARELEARGDKIATYDQHP